MVEPVTINLQHVAHDLGLPLPKVQAAVELLDEGNTVPFITRYRKDQTGGLDEEQIRRIRDHLTTVRLLAERKQTILRSIESQGKLTEKLAKQIETASTTKRLEDLYLPFKPKKQTLATLARSRGLETLASEILEASPMCADLDARAADFADKDKGVATPADALLGAGHILAEQFSERADLRQRLRDILQRTGTLVSKQIAPPSQERSAPPPASSEPEKPNQNQPGGEEPARQATPETAPAEAAATETAVPSPVEQPAVDKPSDEPASAPDASPEESATEAVEDTASKVEADSQPGEPPPSNSESETGGEPSAKSPEADLGITTSTTAPTAQGTSTEPSTQPPTPVPRERLSKAQLKKQQIQEKKLKAFSDYFDYRESVKKVPAHRVLAINRGERGRVLRVKIESDTTAAEHTIDELLIPTDHPHADFLRGCARDALSRLILPSLERELRREMTDKAESHAVTVFARNLRNLLLQPPIRDLRVLAVDPGYRSGCKLVALDEFGNFLEHSVIYLVGKSQRKQTAKKTVTDLVDRFGLKVVVIGNGTASRETEDFFAKLVADELKDHDLAYVIVNEAGASVYSTSRLGREEFPHYDATVRGAISIGRRFQDPLSELVKIDPARIGVGLYQHDVKAKHLHSSLDGVVESCVNFVGVNLNTASPALLGYVSGLNQLTARRVYEYRLQNGPFRDRSQLKQVPGVGEATFVQAAGFLKIAGGDQPLDTTWIHPESYNVTSRVLSQLGYSVEDLLDKAKLASLSEKTVEVDLAATAELLGVGTLLLADILAQLARPGRDPREDLRKPVFKRGVLKLDDLSVGMALHGTILNVVDFGAFVDIGMHDSGLVHISQLANQFVRDPHDVVAVGDIVEVWVVGLDKERRRVSLTMIPPGTKPPERPPRRPRGKPDAKRPDQPAHRTGKSSSRPRKPGRKEGGYDKKKRHQKTTYRPKPSPKPVVPITRKMVAGNEPMRTFGDLVQYYDIKRTQKNQGSTEADSRENKPETEDRPEDASPDS
ncbi:MAG: helix-hairpin-helix domain-containing protein [Pirellulales bacterium]|nr:helix-hairpin-helix domain-containing protein [Pirellulales bacterium]